MRINARYKMILICGMAIIAMILFSRFDAMAAGVSPGMVKIDKILSGTEYKTKVVFSRADVALPVQLKIEIEGKDGKTIVPLLKESLFELKAGQHFLEFPFLIDAKELPGGDYEARIKGVFVYPDDKAKSGSAGMTILTGAVATVRFNVTSDQVSDFEVGNMNIADSEDDSPVFISYEINNKGNVQARPVKIGIVAMDMNDVSKEYKGEVAQAKLALAPIMQISSYTVESGLILPTGEYGAKVVFYGESDKELYSQDAKFRSYPAGTLDQTAELLEFTIEKDEWAVGEVVAFRGKIKNTGKAMAKGQFVVEVFLGGKRLDYLKGNEVKIPKGKAHDEELMFTLTKSGQYKVKAQFKYGISSTENKEVVFRVKGNSWMIALIGAVIVLILSFAVIMLVRRKQKKHDSGQTSGDAADGESRIDSQIDEGSLAKKADEVATAETIESRDN